MKQPFTVSGARVELANLMEEKLLTGPPARFR